MKRLFTSIIAGLLAFYAGAQTAEVEVSYDWTYFDRDGNEITRPMTLLAGKDMSKFYYKAGEFVDSLRATPDGLQKYKDMSIAYFNAGKLSALPKKTTYLYIVKNFNNSNVKVYDGIEDIRDYKFKYDEPLEQQQWEVIEDSTVNVFGYECVKAVGKWRGREWNVWFSPEIPLDNGPWKLCGLPGLILKAEDATGQHRFVAKGIENSSKIIKPVIEAYDYEKMNRKDMLKILRKYDKDPIAVTNALSDGVFAGYHSDPINVKCDFLELDYK